MSNSKNEIIINYSITSNAGSSDPITEGGKITFTITRAKASNSDADK